MAQGPDPFDGLDLVLLFRSSNVDAEFEARLIHGMLQANGVPSVMKGDKAFPTLPFLVLVPRADLEEAEGLVREARAAGPAAAEEAEAEFEKAR